MEKAIQLLQKILATSAECTVMLFEYIGVIIMIFVAIRALMDTIHRNPYLRIRMGKGMTTTLQFLMGGEILRTVITHELNGVLIIGALVIIRTALALLLHWETRHEEEKWENAYRQHEEEQEKLEEARK